MGNGREGMDGIGNLADDGPSAADVVHFGQFHKVVLRHIAFLAEKGHGVTVADEGIPQVNREGEIVGRGEAPLPIGVHKEGEVFVMVVTNAGHVVENGPSVQLNDIGMWDPQLSGCSEDVLVCIRGAAERMQRGGVDFFAIGPVETLGKEVLVPADLYQPAGHHFNAASACHQIIGVFHLGRGPIVRILELEDIMDEAFR